LDDGKEFWSKTPEFRPLTRINHAAIEQQFQIKLGVSSLQQASYTAGVKWARLAVFEFAAAQSQSPHQ
jgi:hypothetical protein